MNKKWLLGAVSGVAIGVLAAPAGIASAQESAQETIDRLRSEGYTVNIDRVGSGPLSECVVTNVRNAKSTTSWSPIDRIGLDDDITVFDPVVVSRSVSVTLNCAG
ncbi:hypothetical protein AU196_05430 [Mycobacterium sp. IS-1742]|uniref:hypothetical protein n=1 Tax=Mycobacterium sp. IS-1742 TaxID=1772285 RepID=UPI00073FF7E1|nr:hypothetical protein [Mycobacterium sp. IS-1742]KUI28003.1 hypothetical protein AU196_05430 [Mycobacterium sp. IS-1742]